MLKNQGRVSWLWRLGRHMCVCVPNDSVQGRVRERVRPWRLGRLACWCDKSA